MRVCVTFTVVSDVGFPFCSVFVGPIDVNGGSRVANLPVCSAMIIYLFVFYILMNVLSKFVTSELYN